MDQMQAEMEQTLGTLLVPQDQFEEIGRMLSGPLAPELTVEQVVFAGRRLWSELSGRRGLVWDTRWTQVREERARLQAIADGAYRERHECLSFLAQQYSTHTVLSETSDADGFGLLVIASPTVGQMSWHVPVRDFDLFPPTVVRVPEPPAWDGHSTQEKYRRLAALAAHEAAWRHWEAQPAPADMERPY